MWYVLTDDGIYGEYGSWDEAQDVCDCLRRGGENAWVASYDEDEPEDIDDDFGFDPYEGCYTYDC